MSEVVIANEGARKAGHTLAIMSGKGGVGKTLITALLAVELRHRGLRVGILDGNITCSDISSLFGIQDEQPSYTLEGIEPPVSAEGIKVMALNSPSATEAEPMVWRGPMVSSAFNQFYQDVEWGELDFLLIDLPPGTADISMSVLQTVTLDGVILVSTPQEVVTVAVKKCLGMVRQMGGRVSGVVENMAYIIDAGGECSEPFGQARGQQLATFADVPLLGQLALDPHLASLIDAGRIEAYRSDACAELVTKLLTSF